MNAGSLFEFIYLFFRNSHKFGAKSKKQKTKMLACTTAFRNLTLSPAAVTAHINRAPSAVRAACINRALAAANEARLDRVLVAVRLTHTGDAPSKPPTGREQRANQNANGGPHEFIIVALAAAVCVPFVVGTLLGIGACQWRPRRSADGKPARQPWRNQWDNSTPTTVPRTILNVVTACVLFVPAVTFAALFHGTIYAERLWLSRSGAHQRQPVIGPWLEDAASKLGDKKTSVCRWFSESVDERAERMHVHAAWAAVPPGIHKDDSSPQLPWPELYPPSLGVNENIVLLMGSQDLAYELARSMREAGHRGEICMYADGIRMAGACTAAGYTVVSKFSDLPVVNTRFRWLMADATWTVKRKLIMEALVAGVMPAATFVHPQARVGDDCELNVGGTVAAGVTLGDYTKLGRAVTVRAGYETPQHAYHSEFF
jgi:hypothetical protein